MGYVKGRLIIAVIVFICSASCRQKNSWDKNQRKYAFDSSPNNRMMHLYDSIAKIVNNPVNPFSPGAQLAFYDNQIIAAGADAEHKAGAEYFKAYALLKLGREKEAIDLFAKIPHAPVLETNGLWAKIKEKNALAYLRYGERTNCVNNHMAESCIFPIQGMGMHMDETGSKGAVKRYEDILHINPGDLTSRWLLNIAYMTLGEYPKKVPAAFRIPGLDIDSSGIDVKPFTDIAAGLKLDTRNQAGGVITDDFNNDGYLDIITSDWDIKAGAMHYFKNNANGSFTDVTAQAGLADIRGGLNMVQADYNNDGYTDILILRGAWLPGPFGKQPRSLLRNNGDGTFTDVTIQSGLLSLHPTQTAVWKDFNNDGWLDLFIGAETTNSYDIQPCELYINNGAGSFTNIAQETGCDISGFVKAVSSADYNNDGWQDIFISTCSGTRTLLKNEGFKNGKLHFSDVTHAARLDDVLVNTFPTWFWDYDNDGWPDIFVCGYETGGTLAYAAAAEALHLPDGQSGEMYLYHNNHDGTFTNVSKDAGLDRPVFAMGSNFGDFDNDGYLDMYLGTGNPDYTSLIPNRLFKNIGGKKFTDVTVAARVGNLQKGHGVSFADLDNDGDQDIYIEVGGAYIGDAYYNSLYMNPGQGNNRWISLSLEGTESNRSAIGARIKLTFKENGVTRTVYRDVNSGGSFGCSPLRKEIGVGMANIIDEIAITWPGKKEVQTFKNVMPGQFLKIQQGSDKMVKASLKTLDFKNRHNDVMACAPILKN